MIDCNLCQHNTESHPAIYATILEMETHGELLLGTYNSIAERACQNSDCATE